MLKSAKMVALKPLCPPQLRRFGVVPPLRAPEWDGLVQGKRDQIKLSDYEIDKCWKAFKEIDTNGNGFLEKAEVAVVLHKTGHEKAVDVVVNNIFDQLSPKAKEAMSFVECLQLVQASCGSDAMWLMRQLDWTKSDIPA